MTNQGTDGPNDLSDIQFTTPAYSEVSAQQLPIRGEKRIIPSNPNLSAFQQAIAQADGQSGNTQDVQAPTINDFFLTGAKPPFVDYMVIRIPHRGITAAGKSDPNGSATFRFLINPASITISRQTVDQQSLTRGGWQFGVWGEDVLQISMEGQTAGQVWTYGMTDAQHQFTESYRNLQQLLMVFENNGYFFEGEAAGQGPLAADFTRRRIKMHQDVELICGNYVWSGMFEAMNIANSADHPYNYNFNLVFLAWKERFRAGSPYYQTVPNDTQLGHAYSAYYPTTQGNNLNQQQTTGGTSSQPIPSAATNPNGGPVAPVLNAANQANFVQQMDPTAFETQGANSGSAFLSTVAAPGFKFNGSSTGNNGGQFP